MTRNTKGVKGQSTKYALGRCKTQRQASRLGECTSKILDGSKIIKKYLKEFNQIKLNCKDTTPTKDFVTYW